MYAIRSDYDHAVLHEQGLADVEPADLDLRGNPAPGRDELVARDRRPLALALKPLEGRITSYNVCYTQFLRFQI